ncbi:MAG: cytochrome P450, partial [Deltaproteobacteria bacterium]|nr:cytochrome P450 [Deltaproteobacteria bacterium]
MAGAPNSLSLAEIVADPHGAFERARGGGVVATTEIGPLVLSHEVTRSLLQDEAFRPNFSGVLEQLGVAGGPFYEWMKISPLDMEGDVHRRWRQVMARAFTPRSVERLRPFLAREAEALVAGFRGAGRVDFMEVFARKLPALGLSELIGVPVADRDRFTGWADTIGLGFNLMLLPTRISEIDAALVELLAYAAELVAARRSAPEDDLVTRITEAAADEGAFPEERIVGSVAGLVFAGHETTKNQLGWMLRALAAAPEEWDRVAVEPGRARDIVEEVLRLHGAVSTVGRLALRDGQVGGCPVRAGDRVAASLWASNRDPAAFPEPARFAVEAN